MKTSIQRVGVLIAGVLALALSGCIEMEQTVMLNADNSGKADITMRMVNPMAAMGGLGLGGANGIEMPSPEEMAKEMAVGMIAEAQGIEAWKDVTYGVLDDGRMQMKGTAYFPDFTAMNVGSGAGGDVEVEGPGMANTFRSEKEDGKWVVEMKMDEPEGEDAEAPKGEPVADADIPAILQQMRAGWQAQKPMLAGMLGTIKFSWNLKVAGTIEESNNFEKKDDNTAGIEVSGNKIIEGMETMMMDDALMTKLLKEGNVDEMGMPEPPSDMAMKMLFGNEGDVKMVIKPGAPLFDYAAEVKEAKENPTPEMQELLKAVEEEKAN